MRVGRRLIRPSERGDPEDAPDQAQGPAPTVDGMWMARALEQARAGACRGEVPVGAVIVQNGRLIAESHNRTVSACDPTAHAESVAIRAAAKRLGDWRLEDCTLYVTLEPCAHCAGAIVLARIPRLVYAAADPKAGMAGTLSDLVRHPRLNHRARVSSGVLADESAQLLQRFFRARRRAAPPATRGASLPPSPTVLRV